MPDPLDARQPSPLAIVAARIEALTGWRQAVAALAAGAVSILAMAPFHLWPVLFLTLPTLVWLIEGARRQQPPPPAPSASTGWKRWQRC